VQQGVGVRLQAEHAEARGRWASLRLGAWRKLRRAAVLGAVVAVVAVGAGRGAVRDGAAAALQRAAAALSRPQTNRPGAPSPSDSSPWWDVE
jgi:hypothetical protein